MSLAAAVTSRQPAAIDVSTFVDQNTEIANGSIQHAHPDGLIR
jgi:hypothetical protein